VKKTLKLDGDTAFMKTVKKDFRDQKVVSYNRGGHNETGVNFLCVRHIDYEEIYT